MVAVDGFGSPAMSEIAMERRRCKRIVSYRKKEGFEREEEGCLEERLALRSFFKV